VDVLKRHFVKDQTDRGPYRHPRAGEVDRISGIVEVFWAKPSDPGQGTIGGTQNLANADHGRLPGQRVTAVGAAHGAHNLGAFEIGHHRLKELVRQLLPRGQILAGNNAWKYGRELYRGSYRIVASRRNLHLPPALTGW
jgi:hypothetical protein